MQSTRVGPYELINLLGQGGAGQVWYARDIRLERKVAIKSLHGDATRDAESVARFRAEARNLAGLNHPNITMLLDIYSEGASEWMIMELVTGQTVETLLAWAGQFSVREALSVLSQVTAGLSYAHQSGLIHRDIKPSNLMITEAGTLKLMDFGVSRVVGSQRQTKIGQAVGTPIYLSPEQCRGKEGDERSDQYSLAVVLYEMLTGHPPFEADNEFDLMRAHLETKPVPPSKHVKDIPKAVDRAVLQALAKDPAQRFESIIEFCRAAGADAFKHDAPDVLREIIEQYAGKEKRSDQVAVKVKSSTEGIKLKQSLKQMASSVVEPSHDSSTQPKSGAAATIGLSLVFVLVLGSGGYFYFSGSGTNGLPAPIEEADLIGEVSNVISGNAIVVGSTTVNLYGIVDIAKTYDEVVSAQKALQSALPKNVACYGRPGKTFECFEADGANRNIAAIAIENGVAKIKEGLQISGLASKESK